MGCCKCLGGLLCVAVLAAAGVCAWRFGPWYEGSSDGTGTKSSGPNLMAENACEGCCNGLVSNCDRPVNEVIFPMVHNAHSSAKDLFVGYNNERSLEAALVAGFRGLMLDSCMCDGSLGETIQNFVKGEDKGDRYLGFCHSTCDAGVRDPAKVLDNIRKFLDFNRNEVLMIEFEINDNSLVDLFNAIDASGLDKYVYRSAIPLVNSWPTMRTLIEDNTRLILFAHGDGMDASCELQKCPEGISYMYDHFQETNWNDKTCNIKGNPREGELGFFLMNHWMNNDADLPSRLNAQEFNSYDALADRFRLCTGRWPNIVAVDFWSVGDVLSFVRDMNQSSGGGVVAAGARSQSQGGD